jgi:hypothetical protein
MRALPLAGAIHDYSIVQQLLRDARRDIGNVDLVGADFFALNVVNGQASHG